jgi:hypothetical protein
MPTYVYGCQNPSHPRTEVVHGMTETVEVRCGVCQGLMHRIPQAFRYYHNPFLTLRAHLEDKYEKGHTRSGRKISNG